MMHTGIHCKGAPKRKKFPLSVTKKKGIDDLVSAFSPQKLEEERRIPPISNIISEALQYYLEFVADDFRVMIEEFRILGTDHIPFKEMDYILTPQEIDNFMKIASPYGESLLGVYVSRLINNSFSAGNNDFHLYTKSRIKRLGHILSGNILPNRELRLNVYGDMGEWGANSIYKCNLAVEGSVGKYFCSNARLCDVTIYGNVGPDFAHSAEMSTFTILGDMENSPRCRKCHLKTPNKRTFDKLLRWNDTIKRNRISYIHEDGEEESVR